LPTTALLAMFAVPAFGPEAIAWMPVAALMT